MRLWHIDLLPYLPDMQFRGQLRELVSIMRAWRDKGETNHLLINRVTQYEKTELYLYFLSYGYRWYERYGEYISPKLVQEFHDFVPPEDRAFLPRRKALVDKLGIDPGWHNKSYLRVCMANLFEKWDCGRGRNRMSDEEWERLKEGYKALTGEEYKI